MGAGGVDLYAPYQENDQTERLVARRNRIVRSQERIRLAAWGTTYVCPQGHRLKRIGKEVRDRARSVRWR